jgi:hypothetical protein
MTGHPKRRARGPRYLSGILARHSTGVKRPVGQSGAADHGAWCRAPAGK